MTVLGPGIVIVSTPLALAVSLFAVARAQERPVAVAALVLSGAEALLLALAVVAALVN
jgi:hypothetical protein